MTSPPGPTPIEDVAPERDRVGGSHLPRADRDEAVRALLLGGHASSGSEAYRKVRDYESRHRRPSLRHFYEWLMQQVPGGRKPRVRRHDIGGPGWRTHT